VDSRLIKILDEKRNEVALLKKRGISDNDSTERGRRDFKGAISVGKRISLIGEIKFRSPSAGLLHTGSDAVGIGKIYEEAGAAAISLLTDRTFFGGDLANLPLLKKSVSLPILRKDFIIDDIQVKESIHFGADAILLIARILSRQQLKDLVAMAKEEGLSVLTEIHDPGDLEKAIDSGSDIIGINNRDLDTFKVDLKTTMELAPQVPEGCIIVGESGIHGPGDIRRLSRSRIHAVLVGTSLMQSADMAEKVRQLVEAGRQ
jgi:indole-3-glycerol phosphate synthase